MSVDHGRKLSATDIAGRVGRFDDGKAAGVPPTLEVFVGPQKSRLVLRGIDAEVGLLVLDPEVRGIVTREDLAAAIGVDETRVRAPMNNVAAVAGLAGKEINERPVTRSYAIWPQVKSEANSENGNGYHGSSTSANGQSDQETFRKGFGTIPQDVGGYSGKYGLYRHTGQGRTYDRGAGPRGGAVGMAHRRWMKTDA